ncbi:hypothetical protein IQ246_06480 [aff. Roholtiella sp. LEGE 12411]|nr:hypothetical protein [aff. Roholtiella sp. LEGE 12411]
MNAAKVILSRPSERLPGGFPSKQTFQDNDRGGQLQSNASRDVSSTSLC